MGPTEVSSRKLRAAACVYWSEVDDVLYSGDRVAKPYDPGHLRELLNLSALFEPQLALLDICVLNNEPLRNLVIHEGYQDLFDAGVMIPMLRDSVSSFSELRDQQARDVSMYTRPVGPQSQNYAKVLDNCVAKVHMTDSEIFGERLTRNLETTLLNRDFARAMNLTNRGVYDELLNGLPHQGRGQGSTLRRSTLFFAADHLRSRRHPVKAEQVKAIASTIYHRTFADPLEVRISLPDEYLNALLPLLGEQRSEPLHVDLLEQTEYPVTRDDIARLSPSEILDIRTGNAGRAYLETRKKLASGQTGSRKFAEAQQSYLQEIAMAIVYKGIGRTRRRLRLKRSLRVATFGGKTIGIGTAILSVMTGVAPVVALSAGFFGIIWVVVGGTWTNRRNRQLQNEDVNALFTYWAVNSEAVNISKERNAAGRVPIF